MKSSSSNVTAQNTFNQSVAELTLLWGMVSKLFKNIVNQKDLSKFIDECGKTLLRGHYEFCYFYSRCFNSFVGNRKCQVLAPSIRPEVIWITGEQEERIGWNHMSFIQKALYLNVQLK